MAIAQKPILLDETGKDMAAKLQLIADALGGASGSGVIVIDEEEFLAHEEEYRASGKTYLVVTPGDTFDSNDVLLDKNEPASGTVKTELTRLNSSLTPKEITINNLMPDVIDQFNVRCIKNGNIASVNFLIHVTSTKTFTTSDYICELPAIFKGLTQRVLLHRASNNVIPFVIEGNGKVRVNSNTEITPGYLQGNIMYFCA